MGSPSQRPRDRRRWVGLGHLRALTFPPGASVASLSLGGGAPRAADHPAPRPPPSYRVAAPPTSFQQATRMTGLVELLAADLNFSLLARARGAGQRAAGI